jgi:transposase
VEGVLWILRTGAPWRDLPSCFGKWETVYRRFARWCCRGVWQRILSATQTPTSNVVFMLDSTIVRAHQHAAGGRGGKDKHAIGRSRGGLSTKIHVLLTLDGVANTYVITAGNDSDIKHAPRLLANSPARAIIIGDKGYDSDAFVSEIKQHGGCAVMPPRCTRTIQREYDRTLYRERNRIERYFARLKQFRRLATRYDKTLRSFSGFFDLANLHLQHVFKFSIAMQ